jgi:methyl-accepting chemotaxis protein
MSSWTFGRKIGAGFAALVTVAVVISAIAYYALDTVTTTKDRVIDGTAQSLIDAESLRGTVERKGSSARGFLLSGDDRFASEVDTARDRIRETLERLRDRGPTAEERQLLDEIERAEAAHQAAIAKTLALRKANPLPSDDAATRSFDSEVVPRRDELDRLVASLIERGRNELEAGKRAANLTAATTSTLTITGAIIAVVIAIGLALILTRALSRQIGAAVTSVQSSSSELQTAATQQATGAREQATAMNEITTTISELLATSLQIAESAQRVARIARDTASSARAGDQTVDKANEAIADIKRQVDLIVNHMLDLGRRSQQIGTVLDIINELAEQTNILAINATIEAAGAGDAGRRFAVVADEIRKLSDRVGASTKEIRGLIDEIRAAVNTTVMTTEGGTKAVDAGTRHFAAVTTSFKQIADLVGTTTDAAREIELSTKQQSTAVEQVNVAVANVAQATRENESSSNQTLQTASQLASLSRDLLRLIKAAEHAGSSHPYAS